MTATLPPVKLLEVDLTGVDLEGAEVPHAWDVLAFELTERLCEPYTLMLSLSTDADVPVRGLVGRRCSFTFVRGDFERDIRGIVARTETIGVVDGHLRIRIWVGPFLEVLRLSRRTRAFHGRTAIDILRQLHAEIPKPQQGDLDTTGLDAFDFRVRDLCVQFDETDLDFVQRLLAEEGVTYSFRHDETEVMVLRRNTAVFHSAAGVGETEPKPVLLRTRGLWFPSEETLRGFEASSRMRPGKATAAMWDWKANPPALQLADDGPPPEDAGETYTFESYRPVEKPEGGPLFEQSAKEAKMQGDRHRLEELRAVGAGDVLGFTDGATFEILAHATTDLEGGYALLSVFHRGEVAPDGAGVDRTATYENRFTCFRFGADDQGDAHDGFAPPLREKPRAQGPMLGTVVGPTGDEIHTDAFGRIKVRMHWDREGEESVCWIPVGQAWAGPGFGAVFVPRVGMEVVITFVAGDPDRPLCTGVVYNGQNSPPYSLPDSKTRSVLKTASSPGGDGFNELSFEDAAGSEEVFLHAERNLREVVKSAHTTSVGASQRNTVGGNQQNHVHGDQSNTVEKDQAETVKGDVAITVEGDRDKTVMGDETVLVQGDRATTIEGSDAHGVTGALTQVYAGGRTTTVTGGDNEVIASGNKALTVSVGALEMISASAATLAGSSHVLKLQDGATLSTTGKLTLTTGESSVVSAGGLIELKATDEIALRCGGASLVLKSDGSIVINGDKQVMVASGESSYTAAPDKTTIQGTSISSTATGVHEVKGALVKLN